MKRIRTRLYVCVAFSSKTVSGAVVVTESTIRTSYVRTKRAGVAAGSAPALNLASAEPPPARAKPIAHKTATTDLDLPERGARATPRS